MTKGQTNEAVTQPQLSSDFLKLTTVFVNHSRHCAQCAGGNCCEMGDALLTGIGLAAVKEQESLGFAFKAAPFVSEREEQEEHDKAAAALRLPPNGSC